jgi:hypothetical protein
MSLPSWDSTTPKQRALAQLAQNRLKLPSQFVALCVFDQWLEWR